MIGAPLPTLGEAYDRCQFRTLIDRPGASITGAWAILERAALPIPDDVLEEVRRVLGEGGAPLLATDRAERDAAKRELPLCFGTPAGRVQ